MYEPYAEPLSLLSLNPLLDGLGLRRGHWLRKPDGRFPESCWNLGAGPKPPLCTLKRVGPWRSAHCTSQPHAAGIAGILLTPVLFFCSSFGSSGDSVIGQLFSCEMENCSMCRCGKETVRLSSTLLFTLSYPESAGNGQGRAGQGLACLTLLRFPVRVGFVISTDEP